MNVLHIISGGDTGGAKTLMVTLLSQFNQDPEMSVTLLCMMEGDFARTARAAGISVKIIEQNRRYDLSTAWKIAAYVRENSFDIINFHGARANVTAVFLRFLLRGRLFCTTVHSDYALDFIDSRYKRWVYTPLNRFALKRFKYLLAVTENMKKTLVSRGFKAERIHVIYNGIRTDIDRPVADQKTFLAQYGLKADRNALYIGIAARLQQVKGIDIFIRGCQAARDKLPNAVFLIAGEGTEKARYETLVTACGLDDCVKFLGHVTDIFSFYNAIDINCLTSRSEGFPSSLLEGGLMRKPTISAACGGVPEMIEDGRSGLLFPIGNADAFADALCRLANDSALRETLGANLRANVIEKFSATQMAETHRQLYRKFLTER